MKKKLLIILSMFLISATNSPGMRLENVSQFLIDEIEIMSALFCPFDDNYILVTDFRAETNEDVFLIDATSGSFRRIKRKNYIEQPAVLGWIGNNIIAITGISAYELLEVEEIRNTNNVEGCSIKIHYGSGFSDYNGYYYRHRMSASLEAICPFCRVTLTPSFYMGDPTEHPIAGIYDSRKGKIIYQYKTDRDSIPYIFTISPDNQKILLRDGSQTIIYSTFTSEEKNYGPYHYYLSWLPDSQHLIGEDRHCYPEQEDAYQTDLYLLDYVTDKRIPLILPEEIRGKAVVVEDVSARGRILARVYEWPDLEKPVLEKGWYILEINWKSEPGTEPEEKQKVRTPDGTKRTSTAAEKKSPGSEKSAEKTDMRFIIGMLSIIISLILVVVWVALKNRRGKMG